MQKHPTTARLSKGAAKEAVRHILTVPGNFSEAMKTLERHFGRPELVVGQLISKVRSVGAVRADDIEGLLSYANAVQNVVSTMTALKSEGHMSNPALRTELVDKLPIELKLRWGEHLKSTGANGIDALPLGKFAEWLNRESKGGSVGCTCQAKKCTTDAWAHHPRITDLRVSTTTQGHQEVPQMRSQP